MTDRIRAVHLPVYRDNAYQPRLLDALERHGVDTIDGGGGGTFLRTALRSWRPHVAHFHWLHPYMIRRTATATRCRGGRLLAEVMALRASGVKVVWTLHNLHNHDRTHEKLERRLTRLFVRMTDAVIAHSPTAEALGREAFGDRRPGRWVVIPHGSYVGCYPADVRRDSARCRLGVAPDETVFLFFGRIQPYKGVLELVRAFRTANPPNARLVIAGKPADADAHRVLAEAAAGCPTITYRPGFVPDDEVQVYFRAADVAVLPFRDVLTSSSVVLAMSFGLPVIAPAVGSLPDTVAAGRDWLYPPDDPNGLANALAAAVARRRELPAVGDANFKRAAADTWDAVARRTVDLYRSLLRA